MRVREIVVIGFFLFDPRPVLPQIPSDPKKFDTAASTGGHRPGSGFSLVNTDMATLNFATYVTIRYLNQMDLDDTYTDAFGRTKNINKRNDIQFQKVMLYFKGWLFDPKFRYLLYVWTSNVSQGQGAQVVVGGNLQYEISKHLDVGAGIGGLPTSRSMLGQWPHWLRQDARPMSEEFFRGSFTTGIWVQGDIVEGLYYKTMLGNNLSQLGIDAGQLDDKFDSWSSSIWWTTRNYSHLASIGDFEKHQKLATLLGAGYSRSNESWQSQPEAEAPENSQIRLSDGTGVFSVNAFNNGSSVLEAKYEMVTFYGGLKYKGFSLDGAYYLRWISKFETTGPIPVSDLFDEGYDIQASAMLIDKRLQLYGVYSKINGEYGKPYEINAGLNFFVKKNKILRINPEVIFAHNSPVGYLAYPTVVGAKGTVFMLNLELFY